MQDFVNENILQLTKRRKMSRKQCMRLKNNQFVRMEGTGYYRVHTIDKLNKTVDVFCSNGTNTYDFDEVIYDKTCVLLDKLYKSSKKFRADHSSGLEEQKLNEFLVGLNQYTQEPQKTISSILN